MISRWVFVEEWESKWKKVWIGLLGWEEIFVELKMLYLRWGCPLWRQSREPTPLCSLISRRKTQNLDGLRSVKILYITCVVVRFSWRFSWTLLFTWEVFAWHFTNYLPCCEFWRSWAHLRGGPSMTSCWLFKVKKEAMNFLFCFQVHLWRDHHW